MKISYVVVDSQGVPLISSGDVECPVWMHSTAKPIQLLPFLDRGLDRKYSLTPEEVVLLASSHLAQPQHVDTLLSVFRKAELKEQMLILPPSAPQGIKSYNNWLKNSGKMQKRYHPCSGNHAAIMLLQRELTGSTDGYEQLDSLAQREILQYIQEYVGTKALLGQDNCGIPTYGVSLRQIAVSYLKLVTASLGGSARRFVDSVHVAPVMLEGEGCISTILCKDRNLMAKTGINYLLAIGSRINNIAVAIKAEDGWDAVICGLCEISNQIKIIDNEQVCELKSCIA